MNSNIKEIEYKKCCGENFIDPRHFDKEKGLKNCGYYPDDYFDADEPLKWEKNEEQLHLKTFHTQVKVHESEITAFKNCLYCNK